MRRGELYLHGEDGRRLLLDRAMRTASVWERMRGLLWRRPPRESEALLIDRCGSVHTCGMGCALDLAFIDRKGMIRRLVRGLKPWRGACCLPAVMTLEMREGTIDRLKLKTGMRVSWEESSGQSGW